MTLMETLKKDQLTARKQKAAVAVNILTTLIGEAAMIGKNDGNRETTDSEVIAIIKKFIKGIDESITVFDGTPTVLLHEKKILSYYLPSQIEGEELKSVISGIMVELNATTMKDMGRVMGELKLKWDGQYDGKSASTYVRELLQ